jgi:hypothetical protein
MITEVLRDADPLRSETVPTGAARERLRHRVMAAAGQAAADQSGVSRRSLVAFGAGALAVVAAASIGFQIWRGTVTLHAAVRFEARLAETAPAPGLVEAHVPESDRIVYLHPETVVTNDDIDRAVIEPSAGTQYFAVQVQFTPEGARKFWLATSGHDGKPMAILIDGNLVMAPTVRGPISTPALITGNYTHDEAQRIVEGITIR